MTRASDIKGEANIFRGDFRGPLRLPVVAVAPVSGVMAGVVAGMVSGVMSGVSSVDGEVDPGRVVAQADTVAAGWAVGACVAVIAATADACAAVTVMTNPVIDGAVIAVVASTLAIFVNRIATAVVTANPLAVGVTRLCKRRKGSEGKGEGKKGN